MIQVAPPSIGSHPFPAEIEVEKDRSGEYRATFHIEDLYWVQEDGKVLRITQSLPATPWQGGLSKEQLREQMSIAQAKARRLIDVLHQHPDWPRWSAYGNREWRWLLEQCLAQGDRPLVLLAHSVPLPGQRDKAVSIFRDVIDFIFRRSYPVFVLGQLAQEVPSPQDYEFLRPRRRPWRALAKRTLRACGEPLDDWHQAVVLAFLLNPELAPATIIPPFWLPPPVHDQTDLERTQATAVGVPDTTERAAAKAKRDMQRLLGFERPRAKPGPKPGTKSQPAPKRAKLQEYIVKLSQEGVSPQFIVQNARAQHLYRDARDDHAAVLNVHAVRRILRRHREQSRS